MAKPEEIKQIIKELNPNAIFVKGFDKALYGTGMAIGGKLVAVYCIDNCYRILIEEHKMEELEALEHFEMAVDGEPNPNKPIFINNWRLAKSIDQIFGNIDLEKGQTLADIIEQVKKKKEEEEKDKS